MSSIRGAIALVALALILAAGGTASAQSLARYNVAPAIPADQVAGAEAQRATVFRRVLANPADLDAAFEYAMLSIQLGDLEAAIATLERMRLYAPDVPRLRLELATQYYRLGAYDVAREHFLAVSQMAGTPPEVQANIARYLVMIDENRQGTSISGFARIGGRYQSNANGGPSTPTVILNGISATLDDVARATPDASATASGGLRIRHVLSGQGDRLEAALSGYVNAYGERTDLRGGGVEMSGGPVISLGRFGWQGAELALNARLGAAMLDNAPYSRLWGLSSALSFPLSAQTRARMSLDYQSEVHFGGVSATQRDGDRVQAAIDLVHILSPEWRLNGGVNLVRRVAVAGYNSYWETAAQIGVSHAYKGPFGSADEPWVFSLAGRVAQRVNDAPDTMVNASAAQSGVELSINATQSIPLSKGLDLSFTAGYRTIKSNYDTRSLQDASVGVSLTYSF